MFVSVNELELRCTAICGGEEKWTNWTKTRRRTNNKHKHFWDFFSTCRPPKQMVFFNTLWQWQGKKQSSILEFKDGKCIPAWLHTMQNCYRDMQNASCSFTAICTESKYAVLYLSYLCPLNGILFPSWTYACKVFQ